jgi:hypothetical protein
VKALIIILSRSLAICLSLVGYQHNRCSALSKRQGETIALIQEKYESSVRENNALKVKSQIQEHSRIALSQAEPLATGYKTILKAQDSTVSRKQQADEAWHLRKNRLINGDPFFGQSENGEVSLS